MLANTRSKILQHSSLILRSKPWTGMTQLENNVIRFVNTQPSFEPEQPAYSPAAGEIAPGIAPHPGIQVPNANSKECLEFGRVIAPHYDRNYLESIKPFHKPPKAFHEYTGYYGVQALRTAFDLVTGYGHGKMNSKKWFTRFLFLETVAGVPGMVGGMSRHLRSLRSMKRDRGWIHTLLEEAENERMHLITFMDLSTPGPLFRAAVIGTQGIFMTFYTLFYLIAPRHSHAFVSYLEEEAVKTYSHCIEEIDAGKLPEWDKIEVPDIAIKYWRLPENATMRDLISVIKADEACHAHVNGVLSSIATDDPNPFAEGNPTISM